MTPTAYTASDLRPGTNIACNGYAGTIREICAGQLEGMAIVRLARGEVCVSISELIRFQNSWA